MNFAVYWRAYAERQLRVLWRLEPDRQGLADAMDAVNRLLRDSAHEQGESRDRPTRRLWFQRPLCVLYEIDEAAKVVYVAGVRWVGN